MSLTRPFGRLAVRFAAGLRRLFGPPCPPPELFASHFGALDDWGNLLARPHWASDAWRDVPDRLPIQTASLRVRELAGQIKGVLLWSPAEDGGVYLYRFGEERPFIRIAASDLRRDDNHGDRRDATGRHVTVTATPPSWSPGSNSTVSS